MELPLIPFTSMFRIKRHVAVKKNSFYFLLIVFLQRFIPQAWEKLRGALKTYPMIFFPSIKGTCLKLLEGRICDDWYFIELMASFGE